MEGGRGKQEVKDNRMREHIMEKVLYPPMPHCPMATPTECHTHLFALQVHKLDPHEVHGKDEAVGVGPEPLVVYREEGTAIEWVVLH